MPQRSLCTATRHRIRRTGVQTVFQNIQIEAAQIFGAENLHLRHQRVKLVFFRMREQISLPLRGFRQRVAVDFEQLIHIHQLGVRVKVG